MARIEVTARIGQVKSRRLRVSRSPSVIQADLSLHLLSTSGLLPIVYPFLKRNDIVVFPIDLTRFRYSGAVLRISYLSDYKFDFLSKGSKRLVDAIDPALVQRITKPARNLFV